LGSRRILHQNPHERPAKSERSPAPRCHAATKAARIDFARDYARFRGDFRGAAEDLKSGLRKPRFPIGSFPPGLPYVRSRAP